MLNTYAVDLSWEHYLGELKLPASAPQTTAEKSANLTELAVATVAAGMERGTWVAAMIVDNKLHVVLVASRKRVVH